MPGETSLAAGDWVRKQQTRQVAAREKVLLWGQGGPFEAMKGEWTERCGE